MKLKKANTNHDFGLHAHRKYNIAMVKKVCVLSTPPSTLFPLFFGYKANFLAPSTPFISLNIVVVLLFVRPSKNSSS